MKKEFDIKDTWMSYEIHPETPPEGMLLSERFQGDQMQAMHENLRQAGAAYGLQFGELEILSNTRLALEASEYARDHGAYDPYHEFLFKAYFEKGQNLSDVSVLLYYAEQCGLSRDGLEEALKNHTYAEKLEEAQSEGQYYQVTGTPTFIINNKYKVVGAQPLESFREALKMIESQDQE